MKYKELLQKHKVMIILFCIIGLMVLFGLIVSTHAHIDAVVNILDSEVMCVAYGLEWDYGACLINYVDGVRSCSKLKGYDIKVYSVEPPSLAEKIEIFVLFGVRFESCGGN